MMTTMLRHLKARATYFWADRRGATALEYGLIAALLVMALLISVGSLGNLVNGLYGRVVDRTTEVTQTDSQG